MPTIVCPNCGNSFTRDNGYLRRNKVCCCSLECKSAYMTSEDQTKRRFWSRVLRRKDDECWTWLGSKDRLGYGDLHFKGKTESAHRVSYILAYGDIRNGLHVLHSCDNASCVNPKQLRLGTPADNTQDKMERGRHNYRPHSGQDNGNAKLTQEQVDEIRRLRAKGYLQSTLAEMFGVHQTAISLILHRKNWKG
jgi:hypothetical protein